MLQTTFLPYGEAANNSWHCTGSASCFMPLSPKDRLLVCKALVTITLCQTEKEHLRQSLVPQQLCNEGFLLSCDSPHQNISLPPSSGVWIFGLTSIQFDSWYTSWATSWQWSMSFLFWKDSIRFEFVNHHSSQLFDSPLRSGKCWKENLSFSEMWNSGKRQQNCFNNIYPIRHWQFCCGILNTVRSPQC